jgi:hypothetical protein
MIRWMTILLVSLFYFSPACASLERKECPKNELIPIKSLLSSVAATNDEFRITEKTEVLLDGRPCRYEQVPEGAVIVLLETVSNESKEIARIHFRSPRQPASSTAK